MKGLILAAGKGTRLRPITFSIPKPLVPIANKPTFLYAVESFIKVGIKNIGIVINEEYKKEFERVISEINFNSEINFTYIIQFEPKGIAHAINCAKEFVGDEPFIIQLGDNIIFHDYSTFIDNNSNCKVLLAKVDDISRYGIAEFNDNKICRLIEKPEKSDSDLALVGLYFFNHKIFDFIEKLAPSPRGEYEITNAINDFLNKYGHLDYDICSYWWKDTGTPSDMLEANKFILKDILNSEADIGKSNLTNVKLGSYVSIGNNCTINNCDINSSIIFDNVNIENVDISDSIIGNNCIIRGSEKFRVKINSILGNQSLLEINSTLF